MVWDHTAASVEKDAAMANAMQPHGRPYLKACYYALLAYAYLPWPVYKNRNRLEASGALPGWQGCLSAGSLAILAA